MHWGCDINQRMIETMVDEVAHKNSENGRKTHWENHDLQPKMHCKQGKKYSESKGQTNVRPTSWRLLKHACMQWQYEARDWISSDLHHHDCSEQCDLGTWRWQDHQLPSWWCNKSDLSHFPNELAGTAWLLWLPSFLGILRPKACQLPTAEAQARPLPPRNAAAPMRAPILFWQTENHQLHGGMTHNWHHLRQPKEPRIQQTSAENHRRVAG